MKSRVFVGIIVVCVIAGCKSRESSNSSEAGVGETQIGTSQNEDLATIQPGDIQPDQQAPKCPNGSVFKENKCVCNDGTLHLGEGWYCLTEGQRCYLEAGCHYGEKTYPQYTTFLNDQFLCGDIIAPETALEYKCVYHTYYSCLSDPYSIGSDKGHYHYHWQCTQEKCHCGNELVSKDHFCTVEKKSPNAGEIKSDNTTQEVKDSAQEVNDSAQNPKDIDNIAQETKDTAQETKDAALETKDTALEDEDAEQEDEDTDDFENPEKRYYGYVCENNTWVYKDTPPWEDYENLYCDGIPLSAIGKKDDFFIDDHVYVNRILDGSEIPVYHCRYGRWVCQKTTGCPCFDGEKTRQISFGEFCENDKANCKNAKSPVSKDESFQKLNNYWYRLIGVDLPEKEDELGDEILNELEEIDRDGVCLEDSCPCGKYTRKCMCGNLDADLYKEFYCSIFPVAEDLGETLKRYKAGGLLICLKEDGCHTSDGRHYPKWATIGFDGFEQKDYRAEHPEFRTYDEAVFYNEALMYHIDAGFDTTTESISVLGECVLDRDDDLVRHSQADGVESYVCDQAVCTCGDARCQSGEICDHGKCRADTCKVHNKTKCLYNTNLVSGIRPSGEPEDSEDCGLNETDDSRMYYDVIECKGGTPILSW